MLIDAHGAGGGLPRLPEEGVDDAHDARGCWLRDCRNVGLLLLIDAHGAGGWLRDFRKKGLMMLMMLGFGTAGTWGC